MSALRKRDLWLSEADYLAIENGSDLKHEYYQGEIYAMAGATPRHNRITVAVTSSLYQQLRGRSCEVFSSDQRLKVEATGLRTYPDVLVVCPPGLTSSDDDATFIDATVIIEILSPSTASYDRNAKWDNYRELPSLRHTVLIEQGRVRVQHLFWENGEWHNQNFDSIEDVVRLEAVGCTLNLADVYEGISLD